MNFEKFKYNFDGKDPLEYIDKYGLDISYLIDGNFQRYFEGVYKIEYDIKGSGIINLLYGEIFAYEKFKIDGNFIVYTTIKPDNICYIKREIEVNGKVEFRNIFYGEGFLENHFDIYQNSEVLDLAIGFSKDNQENHLSTYLHHIGENSKSYSHYRSIANHSSYSKISGMIHIDKDAKNVDSFLDQHGIILNSNASIYTSPTLRIENNEVKASHSATVSKISDEALFYLKSRGIDYKEAMKILINGFIAKVIPNVDLIDAYIE
jgi:hypothetical protein